MPRSPMRPVHSTTRAWLEGLARANGWLREDYGSAYTIWRRRDQLVDVRWSTVRGSVIAATADYRSVRGPDKAGQIADVLRSEDPYDGPMYQAGGDGTFADNH